MVTDLYYGVERCCGHDDAHGDGQLAHLVVVVLCMWGGWEDR